eukprot:COSAG01_NODE_28483_length_660_cov_0.727273_1_plen_191_part_00
MAFCTRPLRVLAGVGTPRTLPVHVTTWGARRGAAGAVAKLEELRAELEALRAPNTALVSRSCAYIGSPCLRDCMHGASIGGGARGDGAEPRGAGGGADEGVRGCDRAAAGACPPPPPPPHTQTYTPRTICVHASTPALHHMCTRRCARPAPYVYTPMRTPRTICTRQCARSAPYVHTPVRTLCTRTRGGR